MTDSLGTPTLELRGVAKHFGDGPARVRAVVDADLHANPGELVLVMGRSGSGKTTLLCLAGGLLRPDAGIVRVQGLDITALPARMLAAVRRDSIGFVFQRFNLLEALTAQENVAVPLRLAGKSRAEAAQRALALLDAMDLHARRRALPRTLSGGEQQRVAIARAIANDPPLLLADEPTANLDAEHGMEVVQLLRDLAVEQGKAVVIVSHDDRLRQVADRVLRMEDGRLRPD